jgi:hypothetical protein
MENSSGEKLEVAIEVDVSDYEDGIEKSIDATQDFEKAVKSTETETRRFGSVMTGIAQGVGQSIVGMAATAGAALLQFGMDSVTAASDINETLSKTDVLFGDVSHSIKSWSETTAIAFGQSKQQALDAAATFAIFGNAAGVTGDDLVEFSTSLAELASDMASFGNTTPEQAIEAIGAALRGESEPLRAYGVLLSDATIKARALSMGLVAVEVDALALSRATETVEKAQRAYNDAVLKFGESSVEATDASRDLEQAGMALEKVLGGQVTELTTQQKLLATQAEIFAQTTAAQGDFGRTSDGLANQQRILDAQLQNLSVTIGTVFLPAWLAIVTAINDLVQATLPPLASGLTVLSSVLSSVFGPIFDAIGVAIDGFGNKIESGAVAPLNFFSGWVDRNMPRIQQIVGAILGAIAGFWDAHGQTIMAIVDIYQNNVISAIQFMLRTILNIVEFALSVLTGDWENAGTILRAIVADWRMMITSGIQGIVDIIVTIWTSIDWMEIGRSIISGIGDGIMAMLGWITNLAGTVSGAVVDSFKDMLGISSPSTVAAEEIGVPFADGISQGLRQAMASFNRTVSGITGDMTDVSAQPALSASAGIGNIVINQYFNGQTNPEMVRQASQAGVASGLRAVGR